MGTMSVSIDHLLQQFQTLSPDEQLKVAEAIDRLTWARRWAAVCERISSRAQTFPTVSDQEVDEMVHIARREKPLSARSSTPPS